MFPYISPNPDVMSTANKTPAHTGPDVDGDEDDYMNMTFEEPSAKQESSIQKRARQKREAELRSRVKSKQEREAEEAAAREAALTTSLDSSNKGFRMLSKLGYKPGTTLGKSGTGASEPIKVTVKEDKAGIGHDTERKRKIEEVVESISKKAREDEFDYRERVRSEHVEKRWEGQLFAAQKITEKLDIEADEEKADPSVVRPLMSANVLWRGIARERLEKERNRRMRHDLLQSGPRLGTFVDEDEDEDDKMAQGKTVGAVAEEELEEEDPELDAFMTLPIDERLTKTVDYLRKEHHYCFWCKYQYPDEEMDGCPGSAEEDHD